LFEKALNKNGLERNGIKPLVIGLETKCREAWKPISIGSNKEPLEKGKHKAKAEGFKKHSNLFPVFN